VQPFLFTRGCAYSCTYCFEPVFRRLHGNKGPAVRRRSVAHAIEELVRVRVERDVRLNVIYDDTFNLDRGWLAEFCRAYADQVRLPFCCKVRPDLLDRDCARALALAGCRLIFMGIEVGSEEIRAQLLNRRILNEDLRRAASLVHEHGMKLVTYNIVGLPRTSWQDDLETLDLNLACRPDSTMVMYLQPYAGTAIHDTAVREGLWRKEDDNRLESAGKDLYRKSMLRYANEGERRRVHNVRDLFGLTLAWPRLRRLVPLMARLPAGGIYSRLGSLWYIYCYHRVLYPGIAAPRRLVREAILQRFPGLRPFERLLLPAEQGRTTPVASGSGQGGSGKPAPAQ
jgi:radical SAM superfamily enzyme YgiQ (UPF0313 family)